MRRIGLFEDLYILLTDPSKDIYARQFWDGTVYIYDKKFILSSFRYYGGISIHDVRLHTPAHLGKTFCPTLHLGDYIMSYGDKLKIVLKEMFPDARKCHQQMRYAYEFSIIEAALLDTNTQIEVTNIKEKQFDVALLSVEQYISSSFVYCNHTKKHLRDVYVKYHSMIRADRVDKLIIPPYTTYLFDDLLTRKLIPIG